MNGVSFVQVTHWRCSSGSACPCRCSDSRPQPLVQTLRSPWTSCWWPPVNGRAEFGALLSTLLSPAVGVETSRQRTSPGWSRTWLRTRPPQRSGTRDTQWWQAGGTTKLSFSDNCVHLFVFGVECSFLALFSASVWQITQSTPLFSMISGENQISLSRRSLRFLFPIRCVCSMILFSSASHKNRGDPCR